LLQALLGDDLSLVLLKPLLIARTAGNPFFLEESVRTLVETGVLVGESEAYRLAQALPAIQVPATVQAVLAARLDRLPPEGKRLPWLVPRYPCPCCRPLPSCPKPRCTVAWRTCKRRSSCMRRACSPSQNTLLSMP